MAHSDRPVRIGVLWRGEPESPVTPETARLHRVFEELARLGAAAVPVVFAEEAAEDVRRRLLGLDGVLVWVDPLGGGRDRSVLDPLLREVADGGVWVSAHPEVILKMGAKDVLVKTREMAWGTETHLYNTLDEMREGLLLRLAAGSRVVKRNRGNGGEGVWKLTLLDTSASRWDPEVEVMHAARGSRLETMRLGDFLRRCSHYFERGGCVVDQPYQARLGEGMIRCYQVNDRVAGFGHQFVTALLPPPPGSYEASAAPPRLYYGPEKPEFQDLKSKLESGWIDEMRRLCGLTAEELPAIWDADFLLGPRTASGEDTYVLCEINISSVFPVPDECFAPLAEAAVEAALAARERRG
ncbi:MAG TPA: Cj0069 family protein [Dehalococcoidia bacterium]|nr:Cj0069 family protein [Dehalococcoidia bacterium]